jgi:hypothetical protein
MFICVFFMLIELPLKSYFKFSENSPILITIWLLSHTPSLFLESS